MEVIIRDLGPSRLQRKEKKKSRKETVNNADKLFRRRKMIINEFEDGIFPLPERPPSFQEGDKDEDKEFIPQEERPNIL